MDATAILDNVRQTGARGLGAPIMLLMLLTMIVIPLPPIALDIFFTFNITLSLVVMLVVVYTRRPLEFSVFPSMLLIATLLRLALNVASTRVVLLEGHTGGDAAGKVIEAFGAFVIGGNYAVGLVVFLILVIINFVVVTKGAGRVSEVSARFTLDAMPGKQMAIDADLNSGLIDQDEARARREDIAREADFYGAMDGASKFVRGDAIAGILILFINIIGGLSIGMAQHGLDFSTASQNYVLLTIGDGLVAQIPSLLLSTSAAIIVTRVASSQDVGGQIVSQLFSSPKALSVAAAVLFLMGIIPGMPNFAFLTLSAAAAAGAWMIWQRQMKPVEEPVIEEPVEQPEQRELSWEDVQPVDLIGLEVGYRLIPLVDRNQGGQLMNRIKGVRRKLSQEIGFLIPSVHIRDNLDLNPNSYRISINGVSVALADIFPDRELAINPGQVFGELQGTVTKDPTFGLDAIWIDPDQKDHAQTLGYTVVDASTVVATHLSEILQSHANELMGHEETQQLLDMLGRTAPKLVEDLVPKALSLSVVTKILQNLLTEHVPIRDFRTIAETLAEQSQRTQDPAALTASVRVALSRGIVQQLIGSSEEIPVAVLDPSLEQLLQRTLQASEEGQAGFEPGLAERLQNALSETTAAMETHGQEGVLLVAAPIRPWMARFAKHAAPGMHILSYNEIPDNRQIKVVTTIGNTANGD
ncbi:MAG: flagellar biosynthesis protein FlhA [Candidatus Thiodiazotropha endolucinida]|uniref:Flagellar biosynthesis protein FlhA n=2 Tax=Candidatus Thiodiazotropha TaxID=1913444 RepID=A0A7Z0VI29_9GAMM|nr:flagellar biosynthesis protein FlhA [Candidatus Thiodiazotropha endolucinida]MBT3011700.1 flagellar biosynthesis protein FlhA [Candidatus Thiodiazotropha sp. (ex Lucina pensylvanica)]MBT3017733.1 flagellar biosynthesis protein FlhA [Candidatus Thiodiazotropha taylori]MBT3040816.1 flagellar biosynthesis protein FlhA [Candidatus Thiodiazotropha sp. (ex Codakia orbicularis)]MBT3032594.1 flagellar biosynthesis protein FlhA [Candidatus Thiodiazotropha sp. (ex Lucina pensylvanica)]MBT3043366.1 fl